MIRFDHFIWASSDLENARKEFHAATGVLAKFGGQHPKLGTHNALVSLGDSYFEMIAADPKLNVAANPVLTNVLKHSASAYFGWVLQCDDFSEVTKRLAKLNLSLTEVGTGSRITPDGETLNYEFAYINEFAEFEGITPFFIRWVNSIHPSVTSTPGCKLLKTSVLHSENTSLIEFLKNLELGLHFVPSPNSTLQLEIHSPKGKVKL